ncbi:MAG: D-2-hydroxyacid dehydrogenase [Myxococcota bacterium]
MKICLTGNRAEALAQSVQDVLPGAEIIRITEEGGIVGDDQDLEVFYFSLGVTKSPPAMRELLRLVGSPSLKWLQGPGAGVDHPLWQSLLDRGVRLTNASGIHAEPIAQYIFTYILHWEREVARHQSQQRARHWEIVECGDLTARTLGIVGYGGIGQAAARIGKAFGMRTLGTRRSKVEDPHLDRFVALENLHDLLAESDYVVLCMPFSDETREMIGEAELRAMGEGSVLINVARGGVVDEPVLVQALAEGWIRGATLDVTAEEPLPESSPLWSLNRCVITPHDAGYSPCGDQRLEALFLDNLKRYAEGEPMINEIEATGLTSSS